MVTRHVELGVTINHRSRVGNEFIYSAIKIGCRKTAAPASRIGRSTPDGGSLVHRVAIENAPTTRADVNAAGHPEIASQ